jgi:hypothetical protein
MRRLLSLFLLFSIPAGAALLAVSCSPPLVRCREDVHCPPDMKCDVRRGTCVDQEVYAEFQDGGPVWPADPAGDGGADGGDAGTTDDGGTDPDAGVDAGTTDAGVDAGTTDAGVDAGMPCPGGCAAGNYCDNGTCKPCNVSTHCGAACMACTGTTPQCSPDGSTCVECTTSSQCPVTRPCCKASLVCNTDVINCI